ncbi:TadE/TadG family type IV pilus assembly protein [Sphingosinicella rhizophila]|uniref:TadE/TadG family type IV pilus assembly protein n=1 Tax=Sphingosinicella rhizophila TaxID=3050082 RepID=A0ABU3Q7A2_9SPHN|nr:TadE/TadG family type IV pilus assembly protein [Sphingosinicella sp. GR2756]MDT9599266.1 TadE/TadG family type IV pilus assembly protein [Sphingosinicella sp. GR2756]
MRPILFRRRIGKDERGATLVEFAFVAPVLLLTLFGLLDLGYQSYTQSILQGALHEAARMATVGDKTGAQIDAVVVDRLNDVVHGAAPVIEKKSYREFSDVKIAEKITTDTAPLGQYNIGDCFKDANGNGSYDTDRGKGGLGNSEDIVRYEVTLTFPRLFPFPKIIGLSPTETVRGVTVLRNQPFASRATEADPICPTV